ncbi:MAG: hypothetical protein SFU25_05885 [Candidatus Caenarcaniphilales bacterium]|nr:hypothetical protein [Candidatus Caenarcaniphilales bacterium]
MQFQWQFDAENEIDEIDILGSINIVSDDNSSNILLKDIYLDDWLYALVQGLQKIRSCDDVELEIISESKRLSFHKQNNQISLLYGDQCVKTSILNLEESINKLVTQIDLLLNKFSNEQIERNVVLVNLFEELKKMDKNYKL